MEVTARNIESFRSENTLQSHGFTVYTIDSNSEKIIKYNRKDFYKVSLIWGKISVMYADREIKTDGITLFFSTSLVPYSCEIISEHYRGYACLFSEEFLNFNNNSEAIRQLPLFRLDGTPVFNLSEEQAVFTEGIFKKMMEEFNADYLFKNDIIRSYISILIHEALKMHPSDDFIKNTSASSRITRVFMDLLEKQFPIENPTRNLTYKTAADYAEVLGVHVNHLNHAVKEATGKTTSRHLSERLTVEAKALLMHTDWNVNEIAYALGFEYLTYFNVFFKKNAGMSPTQYRASN